MSGVLFNEVSQGFTLGFHFVLHFEECSPSVTVNSEFIFWEPEHLVENCRVFEGNVIKHKYSSSISKNETPALALIFQNAHHFFFAFLETPNDYLPNTRWISHKYLFIYVFFFFLFSSAVALCIR